MTGNWTSCHALLADGYGVEDIAQMLRCPVEVVRQEVEALRASGRLEAVLRGKK